MPTRDPDGPYTAPPTPTATATPTPSPETEPVPFECSDLLSIQALYDYNPNVSLLNAFAPGDDTLAGEAVTQHGLACRIINQTSGVTIDVGVVRFTATGLAAKQASVSASSTPSDAFDGYYDAGSAQAFTGQYWVTVTSSDFLEAGDARPILSAVVDGLG